MDKQTFRCISTVIVFKSLVVILLFQSTLSAPVNSTISYDTFLKNITRDNCAFPKGIVLPFKESATTFQYFSELLKICKAPEAMKRSLEAITLCNDIYETLKNITCHSDKNFELPEIKIEFSDNVCKDFDSLQHQHVLEEKSLLKHLTDKFICTMMCENDFLPACKLLLWSFQLQKRIEATPFVQSTIPNSNNQENDAGNGASSGVPETLIKPNQKDPALSKEQQLSNPNQEDPAVENSDSNYKVVDDQHIANDDADKNDLDQTLKSSKDQQNIKEENEIPEDPIVQERKDNELSRKQDQTLKLDDQNQPHQIEDETLNAKVETMGTKTKEQSILIDNQQVKNNKINVDEGPPKPSEPNSEKTTFKNNPALPILKEVKVANNKTEPKKNNANVQNNLSPETQKESPFKVNKLDTVNVNNTVNHQQPAIPGLKDESIKSQDEMVSHPLSPSKITVGANEAKVSIKPEVTASKDTELADTKVISSIGEEDAASITTVADLEKMEEGNGIPEPADKEPDLYNDMESEGEYSKIEYDEDGFYDSSKNKKPEEPSSGKISKPTLAENELPKYDVFPQRNSFGRGPDDIQTISAFPEQEDSHFFFYFLSLVLILMAGYLLFHNKQKIIALIVEGRHERRRRSHGLGYKKLETK